MLSGNRTIISRYRALREVLDTVNDWVQSGEDVPSLLARLQTFQDVAIGVRRPDDATGEVDARSLDRLIREETAIRLLLERGKLTSTDLARASHCSPESARLCLQALAERNIARAWGSHKGRCYQPGRQLPAEIARLGLRQGREGNSLTPGGDL